MDLDLKPNTPPASSTYWPELLGLTLLLILILIILWLIYKRLRQKKEPPTKSSLPPPIISSPAKLALERLEKLPALTTLPQAQNKQYLDQLSDIVRLFIQEQTQLLTLSQTTREINQKLQSSQIKNQRDILQFLKQADQIKFAQKSITKDELQKTYQHYHHYFSTY